MRIAALCAVAASVLASSSGAAQERDRGEGEVGGRVGYWLAQGISAPYGGVSGAMRFNEHALLAVELGIAQFDAGCDYTSGPGNLGCDDATRLGFATIGARFELGSGSSRPFVSFFIGSTLLDRGGDGIVGGGAGFRADRPSGFAIVPEATMQWIKRPGGFERALVITLGIVYAP